MAPHCYVDAVADGVVRGFHHLASTVRGLDASASWYTGLSDGIQLSIFYEGD